MKMVSIGNIFKNILLAIIGLFLSPTLGKKRGNNQAVQKAFMIQSLVLLGAVLFVIGVRFLIWYQS